MASSEKTKDDEKMTDYEKIHRPWALLSSKDKVDEKIEEHKDKLVVILFNLSTIQRFSVEEALKSKRHIYEDSSKTKFFKCVVLEIDDKIAKDFEVTKIPTFIFYRNGNKCEKLVKPSAEELFQKLDHWSKQQPQQQQNP